ncbi:hypothetical protein [Nonomuraea ceibae]
MTRLWPQYNGCRSKLDRRIPVIVLEGISAPRRT